MAGSISTVYADIKLSVQGIYQDLIRGLSPAFNKIEKDIGDAVKQGFGGASAQVSNSIADSIEKGIRNVNFGNISTGFTQSLNSINLSNFTSDIQNALGSVNANSLASDVSDTLNAKIPNAVQQSFQSVNVSSFASSVSNAVQSQVSEGAQQGLSSISASSLGSQISNAVSSQVSEGAQQGLSSANFGGASTSGIQSGTQDATQSGAVSGFKKAGPAILGAIAALGIGTAVSGSLSSALEKNVSETKVIAGLNLDASTEKRFKEAASTLWKTGLSDSRDEVNSVIGDIVSSSEEAKRLTAKELGEVGKQVQTLVSVYDFSSAEIAQSTGAMVKNGLAKDLNEANQLLTASLTQAPAQAREEMIAAISEYGRNFKSLDLSGREAFASLIYGSKEGMMGVDKVGDAIKEVTLKVGGLDKSSSEALAGMGYSSKAISETQKAFASGGDIGSKAFKKMLQDVKDINDPVKQQTAAIALFGTQMEDLGAQDFGSFADSILNADLILGDVNSISEGVQKKMTESFGVQVQGMKNQWSDLTSTMGESILTSVMPYLSQLMTFLDQNSGMIGETIGNAFSVLTEQVLPTLLPVVAELLPLISAVWQLISPLVEVILPLLREIIPIAVAFIQTVADIIVSIEPILPILVAIGVAIAAFMIVIKIIAFVQTLTAIFTVLGGVTSIAFAPITLIAAVILAIIVVVVLLIQNWDAVKAAVIGVFTAVGDFFRGMWEGIKSISAAIGDWFKSMFQPIIDMVNWVGDAWNNLFGGGKSVDINMNTGGGGGGVPAMATGGDVMGATLLVAGEKDPETIVNRGLMNENLSKQNSLMAGIMSGNSGNSGNSGTTVNRYGNVVINGADAKSGRELYDLILQEEAKQEKR